MSRLMPVLAGTFVLGAMSLMSVPASAMPMSSLPQAGAASGLVDQAKTICNFDRYGRRFCYNTSGRPLYPRPHFYGPRRHFGPPPMYGRPRYYRPY
jgi:hypothetical protein